MTILPEMFSSKMMSKFKVNSSLTPNKDYDSVLAEIKTRYEVRHELKARISGNGDMSGRYLLVAWCSGHNEWFAAQLQELVKRCAAADMSIACWDTGYLGYIAICINKGYQQFPINAGNLFVFYNNETQEHTLTLK